MSDNRETGDWSIPVLSKDPKEEAEKPKHDDSNDKRPNGSGVGKDGKKDDAEVNDMVSSITPSLEESS